jgi:hypothetical protein
VRPAESPTRDAAAYPERTGIRCKHMTTGEAISPEIYVHHMLLNNRWHAEERDGQPHTRSVEEHNRDVEIEQSAMVYVWREGTSAWEFVLSAIRAASDDDRALSLIGVGLLGSLIIHHGEVLMDDIERQAANNTALRIALRSVWSYGPVQERIDRILGGA